jgi:putative ABC transport system permease protein
MDLLVALNVEHGITILMVTHEPDMAAMRSASCASWTGTSKATSPTTCRSSPGRNRKLNGSPMLLSSLLLAIRSIAQSAPLVPDDLGIVIGVSAVITMVTLGHGATQAVQMQISSLGTNLLMVRPGQRLGPAARRRTDLQGGRCRAIEAQIGGIAGRRARRPDQCHRRRPTAATGRRASSGHESLVHRRQLEARVGPPLQRRRAESRQRRLHHRRDVRREIYGGTRGLGEQLRIKQFSCEVIGVLASKGQASMGNDQDDTVVVPLHTLQRRVTGNQRINTLLVSMEDDTDPARLKEGLRQLLRERRKLATGDDDNFNVLDTQQLAETLSGTTKVMTTLLGAVAAVSLLVGGIGIMNIMLVSVTERTREIGLRLAIGALEREVLLQFLIEAVTLAAMGGIVGIVIATGASILLAQVMEVPFLFDPWINLLSFIFSAGIGVLFGYVPRAQGGATRSDRGAAPRVSVRAFGFVSHKLAPALRRTAPQGLYGTIVALWRSSRPAGFFRYLEAAQSRPGA